MSPRDLQEACWFAKCGPTEKSVLNCLAFHAAPNGSRTYPGIRRIQKLTGLAKSTVENSIAALVGRGYITIVRHGNQVSANEYKINLAALMENAIDAPELRPGVSLLEGQGVSRVAGQGVPEGVPTRDREVSRSDAKGVPPGRTEQTTTEKQQIEQDDERIKNHLRKIEEHDEGVALWKAAREELRATMNPQSWDTWIHPLTATMSDGALTIILPGHNVAVYEDRITGHLSAQVYAALDKAAEETGIKYAKLVLRSGESTMAETYPGGPPLSPYRTDSERRRQEWKERQRRSA